jgi:peptidyl-prolyl cis-trans isomerase D
MKNNEERYKTPETRSIDFVTFPLVASAKDTAIYREDIIALRDELASTTNDSTFARINSEGPLNFGSYTEAQLPLTLVGLDLQEGEVYGPFISGGFLAVHKVSQIQTDGTKSAKASHILFRTNNGEDAAAKRSEAEEVLSQLRGGADFATLAREYSDDTSGAQGGDLGWFSDGGMIAPFNDAVFAQSST